MMKRVCFLAACSLVLSLNAVRITPPPATKGVSPAKKPIAVSAAAVSTTAKGIAASAVDVSAAKKVIPDAYYDKSTHANDYNFIISGVTQKTYVGSLPGQSAASLSPVKWYYQVALFDGNNLVGVYEAPASLLVTPETLDASKPTKIAFIPRKPTKAGTMGWDREFFAVENGMLVKYSVWADKNPETGKMDISVDFGKRWPLYVTGNLDPSYAPWADANGNIIFSVIDAAGATRLMKWNNEKEIVEGVFGQPKKSDVVAPTCSVAIDGTGTTVSVDNNSFVIPIDFKVITIDPIGINQEKVMAPYLGLGTADRPLKKGSAENPQEYEHFVLEYQIAPGQLLVLYDLIASGKSVVASPELTAAEQAKLKEVVNQLKETYDKKKDLLRELKLVMREKGARSILKKWLTNAEVDALIAALSLGGGGVVVTYAQKGPSKGAMIFNHQGKTEVQDGAIVVPWGYYRSLKTSMRKGVLDDKNQWEAYADKKAYDLKRAIELYSKNVITKKLKAAMDEFNKIAEQKSWDIWFEKENKSLTIELLFDYLASLDGTKLNLVLKNAGVSGIKARRVTTIVDMYRKTNLYLGLKVRKPAPAA